MSIHIVTHCYAERLPQYAALLRMQLDSLMRYPPGVRWTITVCYTRGDWATLGVLQSAMISSSMDELPLIPFEMSPEELGRRSVGRNVAALNNADDLVWFTDVDHLFGQGCLDHLVGLWLAMPKEGRPLMVFPSSIMISRTHTLGDEQTARGPGPIMPEEFVQKAYARAIGGVQIVDGDYCREHGYLNERPRWRQPRTDGRMFADFHDDVRFRRLLSRRGSIAPVSLPGLYRVRHSRKTYGRGAI